MASSHDGFFLDPFDRGVGCFLLLISIFIIFEAIQRV